MYDYTVIEIDDHFGDPVGHRLDARKIPEVREALHGAVATGTGDLLVHVPDLEIWDGGGLRTIAGAHRLARRAGRRLVLVDVSPRQERLLRAVGLLRVLTVRPAEVVEGAEVVESAV